jgi:hypothetical protein
MPIMVKKANNKTITALGIREAMVFIHLVESVQSDWMRYVWMARFRVGLGSARFMYFAISLEQVLDHNDQFAQ